MAEKHASAVWHGNLLEGRGEVSVGSGVLKGSPLTWQARTNDDTPETSPEEMVAAAHAGCYAMAFSHALATAGTPAERLDVSCNVGFGPKPEGGMKVTHAKLVVRGKVPGMTQEQFAAAAVKAEAGCPISNAVRGNVEITVEAHLV